MADYSFLATIFNQVNAATAAYVTGTASQVAASIAPVAKQCFTLYIMLWGFAMYRGAISEPIMDAAFRLMKIGLILHFALDVGEYSGMISSNLVALPDYLVTLIGDGAGAASVPGTAQWSTLDKVLSDSINTGTLLWEQGSLSITGGMNLGPIFLALIIWIGALLCTCYAAFLIILSKVALAILMGIGPIFILSMMFEGTKRFFEVWLGQCINYALTATFAVSIVKLLFGIFANAASGTLAAAGDAGGDFGFLSCASLLAIMVICFLVLMQVQGMASALSGGVAVSTLGAVNWASSKMGGLRPSSLQKGMRGVGRDISAAKSMGAKVATPMTAAYRKLKGGNQVSKAA